MSEIASSRPATIPSSGDPDPAMTPIAKTRPCRLSVTAPSIFQIALKLSGWDAWLEHCHEQRQRQLHRRIRLLEGGSHTVRKACAPVPWRQVAINKGLRSNRWCSMQLFGGREAAQVHCRWLWPTFLNIHRAPSVPQQLDRDKYGFSWTSWETCGSTSLLASSVDFLAKAPTALAREGRALFRLSAAKGSPVFMSVGTSKCGGPARSVVS